MSVVNLLRLHEAETAILFCATRDTVRRLHASLTERGFHAVALSGEHSQSERNHALQALRDKRARVCVATDVAARGIDLPSVSLVIHVELPRDAEALQHRSGRTGRAGRKGIAVLIVPFRRRRNVETMLRGARHRSGMDQAADARADPRASDRERLLATLVGAGRGRRGGSAAGRASSMAQLSPEEIAAALVRVHCAPTCRRRRTSLAQAARRRAGRDRGPRPASRARSGSGSTPAGATMPIRAGSCR